MSRKNEIVASEVSERKALWAAVRRAEPIQQVRRLMREKKLLNKDLAERMGIAEAGVSRLLKGNQNIQIDTLYMLADALEETLSIDFGCEEVAHTYEYDDDSVGSYFDSVEEEGEQTSCKVVHLHSFRKSYLMNAEPEDNPTTFALACA